MKFFIIFLLLLVTGCAQLQQHWTITPEDYEAGLKYAQQQNYTILHGNPTDIYYIHKKLDYHSSVNFADDLRDQILYSTNWWTFEK